MHTFVTRLFLVCLLTNSMVYPEVSEHIECWQAQVQEKSNVKKVVGTLGKTIYKHPWCTLFILLYSCGEMCRKSTELPGSPVVAIICGSIMTVSFAHDMLHEYDIEHDCRQE